MTGVTEKEKKEEEEEKKEKEKRFGDGMDRWTNQR